MGFFIDCHFWFQVQLLCLNLHIEVLWFEYSEWKWSAKWRNSNISDIFFSLSSIDGRKQRRWPGTFAPCMGTMLTERARQENIFRFKEDRVIISDTPRFRKTFGVWWRLFKHINPQRSTSVYARIAKFYDELEHSTVSCDICIQWARLKNRVYACSKPKP